MRFAALQDAVEEAEIMRTVIGILVCHLGKLVLLGITVSPLHTEDVAGHFWSAILANWCRRALLLVRYTQKMSLGIFGVPSWQTGVVGHYWQSATTQKMSLGIFGLPSWQTGVAGHYC